MNGWKPVQEAPRDREVWLFLPSAERTVRPDGTVTDVKHKAVVGKWDGHWVDRTGNAVYPSLWHDAAVNGVMPDNPLLEA